MTRDSRDDPPAHGKAGRRILPKEDVELWKHVASSVKPLRRAKKRVPDVEMAPAGSAVSPVGQRGTGMEGALNDRGRANGAMVGHALSQAKARLAANGVGRGSGKPAMSGATAVDRTSALHRRQTRRIATGRTEIEARLDLHGLTQAAAHARLAAFLASASARGLRTVLVITGKGGRQRPGRENGGASGGLDEQGVLQRNVPRWLNEPGLAALVVGHGPAARHHGGTGALYIHVRSRSRKQGA